jgi:hypothetical protein
VLVLLVVLGLASLPARAQGSIFYEDWESGVGAWTGGVTLAHDASSLAGPTVQEITTDGGGGQFFSPGITVAAGTYCLSAWIRWTSGHWPFVGLVWTGVPEWLIGAPGDAPTAVPDDAVGWHYYQAAFEVPSDASIEVKDELWNQATKGGDDLADFDGITLTAGACSEIPTSIAAASVSAVGSLANDSITFSAQLTSQYGGTGVPSKTITFTMSSLGEDVGCQATTDSSGVATCSIPILQASAETIRTVAPLLLDDRYTATFAGDDIFQPSDSAGRVTGL